MSARTKNGTENGTGNDPNVGAGFMPARTKNGTENGTGNDPNVGAGFMPARTDNGTGNRPNVGADLCVCPNQKWNRKRNRK